MSNWFIDDLTHISDNQWHNKKKRVPVPKHASIYPKVSHNNAFRLAQVWQTVAQLAP
jgi:hypothetical protein